MQLQLFKQKMDSLDGQIIGLIAERNRLARKVANYKKSQQIPLCSAKQRRKILEDRLEIVRNTQLDIFYMRRIFIFILNMEREIERFS